MVRKVFKVTMIVVGSLFVLRLLVHFIEVLFNDAALPEEKIAAGLWCAAYCVIVALIVSMLNNKKGEKHDG
jgi:uncharacterized membrane protein